MLFRELRQKYHVFLLHRPFFDPELDRQLRAKWESVIGGEHIFELDDPKAVVDVILGCVAMVSGSRTLDKYMVDLDARGQTAERQAEVYEEHHARSNNCARVRSTRRYLDWQLS